MRNRRISAVALPLLLLTISGLTLSLAAAPVDRFEGFMERLPQADVIAVGKLDALCFSDEFTSGTGGLRIQRLWPQSDVTWNLSVQWTDAPELSLRAAQILDGTAVVLLRKGDGDFWTVVDLIDEYATQSSSFTDAMAEASSPVVEHLAELLHKSPPAKARKPDDSSRIEIVDVQPAPGIGVSESDTVALEFHYSLDPAVPLSEYSLIAVFETLEKNRTRTAGAGQLTFTSREGTGTFEVPLREAVLSTVIAKPLRVRLFLNRFRSTRSAFTVASTEPIEWPVVGE